MVIILFLHIYCNSKLSKTLLFYKFIISWDKIKLVSIAVIYDLRRGQVQHHMVQIKTLYE